MRTLNPHDPCVHTLLTLHDHTYPMRTYPVPERPCIILLVPLGAQALYLTTHDQQRQAPVQQSNQYQNQQQARPAPQGGCYRCGSHEHYASACPRPSMAQALVKEAEMNLETKDFYNAELNYSKALFVHHNVGRSSEALKSDDLLAMYDISRRIREHYAGRKKSATQTPATLPVLHTDCHDQGAHSVSCS